MQRVPLHVSLAAGSLLSLSTICCGAAFAAPHVEFDYARTAECRDVTPGDRFSQYPNQRLVEFALPISVRFCELSSNDVDELTVEISGAASNMRVFDFSPATQLATDIANPIETTKTTKSARSLDGSLGGALPIPYAAEVAHVTPSINAGISGGQTTTEKMNRLPPKEAVVVSGTASEGRGVFFKLKPSSQTSLEGVHELAVTFVVPAGWRGGDVHVRCNAGGQRKVLFMKQSTTLGAEGSPVRLYLTGRGVLRQVAKPVLADASTAPAWQPKRPATVTAKEVVEMVKDARAASATKPPAIEVVKVKAATDDAE